MTQNQYRRVAENFAKYADSTVNYKLYIPSADRKVNRSGCLKGIGMGVNANSFIIADCGRLFAIYYEDVIYPSK